MSDTVVVGTSRPLSKDFPTVCSQQNNGLGLQVLERRFTREGSLSRTEMGKNFF